MIAIGFSWGDVNAAGTYERREVVVVGAGDLKHIDRITARIKAEVPASYKWQAIGYIKPFVEGGRPPVGFYDHGFVGWWKPVEVLK